MGNAKRTVVFVHGDFQNHTVFSRISSFFESKRHRTLMLDLPGHGANKMSGENKISDFIDVEISSRNIEMPIFVAHSSGASLVADYIEKTGNASGMVLISPLLFGPRTFSTITDIDGMFDKYKAMSRQSFREQKEVDYSCVEIKDVQKTGLMHTDPLGFEQIAQFYLSMDEFSKIYSMDMPVIYIYPTSDAFIPIEAHMKSISRMKKVMAHIVDGGHNIHLSNTDEVLGIIKNNYLFLNT